jgi:hypothetical protein
MAADGKILIQAKDLDLEAERTINLKAKKVEVRVEEVMNVS